MLVEVVLNLQQYAVARIWTSLMRLDYIMSLSSKPFGYECSGPNDR